MDGACGDKSQIPNTESQKGLTTGYADPTMKSMTPSHPCHPGYPWSRNSLLNP
jgi:hypothetical protein